MGLAPRLRQAGAGVGQVSERVAWTGPRAYDLANDGVTLRWSVPAERWPYGPPHMHEDCCNLRPRDGKPGGVYCDCKASDNSDDLWGDAP